MSDGVVIAGAKHTRLRRAGVSVHTVQREVIGRNFVVKSLRMQKLPN